MLGSPAGPGGPSQRGSLWPLAPAPAPTATSFATPDGFNNKYGVYSLFPGGPSLGSAIYSHSSTIAGRFTASGTIQPTQTGGGPFHAATHKISDSLFSTGYTFGAPTPPPGSPYSPIPVAQLEFLTKGFNASNVITIHQPQQTDLSHHQHHQTSTSTCLSAPITVSVPDQLAKKFEKTESSSSLMVVDDGVIGKYCGACFKQSKFCNCTATEKNYAKSNNSKSNNVNSSNGGCSRTNPLDWSGVSIKKEPGIVVTTTGSLGVTSSAAATMVPCQVAEITTSMSPMVKVEITSPTIQNQKETNNLTAPIITTNGNIPVGIAVARQRIQHQEVVAASPSLPPAGLLTTVNTSTQIKEISRMSEFEQAGMAAAAAASATGGAGGGPGLHGGVHGGSALLQCADDRTTGLGGWPMCGTHNSALTAPTTLWQYPTHLPIEPVVPVPVPPVGFQLVREPNTGHLLLLPSAGIEQAVVWPSYATAAQPSPHVLFPPMPPPPLQLLSSSSSDYLATSSTTLHQHTQTHHHHHHHSTRLVALTTDPKRKLPLPMPATTTTLIKIETDPINLEHHHHHHQQQQQHHHHQQQQPNKTLHSVVGNQSVFAEQPAPLVTAHVIYQHPTNLILSSSNDNQTSPTTTMTVTGCRSQGTSPVSCLTPPPETSFNGLDEDATMTTTHATPLAVQDASNQTETPSCSGSEDDDNNNNSEKKAKQDEQETECIDEIPKTDDFLHDNAKQEVVIPQESVIEIPTLKAKKNVVDDAKKTESYVIEEKNVATNSLPDLSGLELLSNTVVVHEKNHVNDMDKEQQPLVEEERKQEKCDKSITEQPLENETVNETNNYSLGGLDLLCALAEQRIIEEGRDKGTKSGSPRTKRQSLTENRALSDGAAMECKKQKLVAELTVEKVPSVQIKEEMKVKPIEAETFHQTKKIKLEAIADGRKNIQVNGNDCREESYDESDNDAENELERRRKRRKRDVRTMSTPSTSPNSKCPWKEDNYRTYKTPESELEVRKYLASKSQTIYLQNDDFYYWPPCNTFEIEMRKQLADLQKQYKEKQKELNKLKPKSKQKNRSVRGGERKSTSDRSPNRPATITPPPPVLDKIEDLPPPLKLCNGKIAQELLLKPPTLLRISNEKPEKEPANRIEKSDVKKSDKLAKRDVALNGKREEKLLQKKQEKSNNERKDKTWERLLFKEKDTDKAFDYKEKSAERKSIDKKRPLETIDSISNQSDDLFVKDNLVSHIETSSSQKRKVGRPKKLINKQGLAIGTETIVAKKPKKNTLVGYFLAAKEQFLQERLYSATATNSPPRYPEESIKIHRAIKHGLKKKHDKNKEKCKIRPKLKAELTIKSYTEEEEEEEDGEEDLDEEIDEEEVFESNESEAENRLVEPIISEQNVAPEHLSAEEDENLQDDTDVDESSVCKIEIPKKKVKNPEKKKKRKKLSRDRSVIVVDDVDEAKSISEDDDKLSTILERDTEEEYERDSVKGDDAVAENAESCPEETADDVEKKELVESRCTLTNEQLGIDKLRVLTARGGLFYAGHLSAVEPPDVYSITLDGERGNRPHIMSREEILRDAIVEVSPSSTEELTPGTRLCAYWSQQYRCLYPGSVAEPGTPDPLLDSKFVSVEFDDGDSGRIAIEDIRLLPTDYPIIEYDPNPLLSLSKRKRRTSASISTEDRRTTCQQHQQQEKPSQQTKLKLKDDIMEKENKDTNKQESSLVISSTVNVTNTSQMVLQQQQHLHREKKRMKKRKREREKILNGSDENNKKRKRKHKCNEEFCKHKRHHKKHRKHKKHHHQHEKTASLEDEIKEVDNNNDIKKGIISNVSNAAVVVKDKKKKTVTMEVSTEPEPIDEEPLIEEETTAEEVDTRVVDEEDEEVTQEEDEDDEDTIARNEVTLDDILESKSKKSKKIRDRQESCESRSKMSAFLPARQLWGWSGKGYRRPRVKGRTRKLFYKAIQRGKETIMLGDSAVFLSTGRPDRPYIGRIEAMWEACGTMVVKVKWFYHPEETVGCPLNLQYPGALFESPHVDENDVQTISHKCEVLPLKEYKEKLGDDPQRYAAIYDNNDIYYLAGYYDPTTTTLKFQNGIPFTNTPP